MSAGTRSYIPIGPQNLSVQITDISQMPVYTASSEVSRIWAPIGLVRIQNLPNDGRVLTKELEKIKTDAAKLGAQALVVNRYFDENGGEYPVTIAAYYVKFMDRITTEDKEKVEAFASQAAIESATR
jgi:hypothetical protein